MIVSDWATTGDCSWACWENRPPAFFVGPWGVGMPWGVEDLSVTQRLALFLTAGVDQIGGSDEPSQVLDAVAAVLLTEDRIDASAHPPRPLPTQVSPAFRRCCPGGLGPVRHRRGVASLQGVGVLGRRGPQAKQVATKSLLSAPGPVVRTPSPRVRTLGGTPEATPPMTVREFAITQGSVHSRSTPPRVAPSP
jgi:hypothetical protein